MRWYADAGRRRLRIDIGSALSINIMSNSDNLTGDYHLDLEEDYEANHKNGWRPDPYGEGVIPVGTCTNMCTYEEMQERERQKRLSKYEMIPNTNPPKVDTKLAMKEFSRSAAGREFSQAMNLRPWSVLRRGLHHLLLDISLRTDDWMYICGFVFDRLKSIRQDMVIQRIDGLRSIEILEGSVRFLIYSMYKLTCDTKDYTIQQPFKIILSPEGTPVSGLNNYEINIIREMKLTTQCLRDCLNSLIIQYQEYVPDSPNRYLFESINMIVNLPQLLGHHSVSSDLMSKRELRNSDKLFKTVFHMRREHVSGNHLTALKQLPQLREHPLVILAYSFVLPIIQISMLARLRKAYSSRGPSLATPDHLCKLICPEWLDVSYDERLIFTIFIAIQCGIFDEQKDLINFNHRNNVIPEPVSWYHQKTVDEIESDNETRIYAMQMIAGRNWSLFAETLKVYGLESVLDPRQGNGNQ